MVPDGLGNTGEYVVDPKPLFPETSRRSARQTSKGKTPRATEWMRKQASGLSTRVISLTALVLGLWGVLYVGVAAFHGLNDSFVAPIVLSPDSEVVIQSKLSLSKLESERKMLDARLEENDASIDASDRGIEKLKELQAAASKSLGWSKAITSSHASASANDLQTLGRQKKLLEQSVAQQASYIKEMEQNLAAGLVHKSDLIREQEELNQLRLGLLQNDRDRIAAETLLHESSMAQTALKDSSGSPKMATPEMLEQHDQLVRIELELLKLQADRRGRAAQKSADEAERVKLDELIAQMKTRPVFRAIEGSQNVAFVPYTQAAGVKAGGSIYECAVWGMFGCEHVGEVIEVLPGEVAMPDPWGNPSRGQYAVLRLVEPAAAQSKTLRVRDEESKL